MTSLLRSDLLVLVSITGSDVTVIRSTGFGLLLLQNTNYCWNFRFSQSDHEVLLGALLPQLSLNQASVRKKAVSSIASLSSSLSDGLLAKGTVDVVQLLKSKATKSETTRTNIQMIGALSRAVGYRFGPQLGDTVPMLIGYCNNASENDEELKEYSLQALESFLLRCPGDISSYCDQILRLTLEFLSCDAFVLLGFADLFVVFALTPSTRTKYEWSIISHIYVGNLPADVRESEVDDVFYSFYNSQDVEDDIKRRVGYNFDGCRLSLMCFLIRLAFFWLSEC
ncbi:cullin-associated NEDD8-dissociated protein 1-like [Primulina huaijiensis]|uniref:cullin-associated NEDD8-dissociated protein 1-like n=1 Tax=Primulina huaijiensis TaxID=1492673 RepID=UPI003CC744DA